MLQFNHRFEALGTWWSIESEEELSEQLQVAIHDRIKEFDRTYSRFRDDSLVSRIKTSPGSYTFPPDADKLIRFYRQLYDLTGGKVTPLIGEMLERAGYDAHYSLESRAQKQLPKWDDVMQWKDPILTTKQPITIDIGAAGKGYLVDIIGSLLEENGIREYVVDASGDIRHRGTRENKVGLEHPLDPGKVIGVIDVQGKSLCASASNRRAWGSGMHHIFDPDTMSPTNDITATWVIADDTMTADGLATALFFVDPQVLAKEFKYEYARIHSNGTLDYSHAFEGRLF